MSTIDGNTPILSDARMRELGFTDFKKTSWYFCSRVESNVTLNITIDKKTGDYSELVMNEFFGQPEYYGEYKEPHRSNIKNNIDEKIHEFQKAGLTGLSVDHSLYKWTD